MVGGVTSISLLLHDRRNFLQRCDWYRMLPAGGVAGSSHRKWHVHKHLAEAGRVYAHTSAVSSNGTLVLPTPQRTLAGNLHELAPHAGEVKVVIHK